jgi:DNA-binding CsgD family transcriptional regulator
LSEACGSVTGQVEANSQLALCEAMLGDLAGAEQSLARARELAQVISPLHRLHLLVEVALASVLGYLKRDGDWPALAAAAGELAASPQLGRTPLGFTFGAFAALNYALAGQHESATRALRALALALRRAEPSDYLANAPIWMGSVAVWELQQVELAGEYLELAERAMQSGINAGPAGPMEQAVARMRALRGDKRAELAFDDSRKKLAGLGMGPLQAILDCDAAKWTARTQGVLQARPTAERARTQCNFLGMSGWSTQLEELLATPETGGRASSTPAGLTGRELEVLRLVAAGHSNREIAEQLVIAVPTVERHISNLYAKIGARGRADATAFAIRQDILETPKGVQVSL